MRHRGGIYQGAVHFTGASLETLRSLRKRGLIRLEEREVFRRVPAEPCEPAGPVCLNEEQEAAFRG